MMLRILSLLIALAATVPAVAGSATIGAQWPLRAGYNAQGQTGCYAPAPYVQCVFFPGQVIGWTGTQTIKGPGIELLMEVVCGVSSPTVIWTGEHLQGTIFIVSPAGVPANIVGPCWVAWQAGSDHDSGADAPIELQFTIFFQ